jgi:hypothetical protein
MAKISPMSEHAKSQRQVPPLVAHLNLDSIRKKEVALDSSNKTLAVLAKHAGKLAENQRRLDRSKAVLPVRITGTDTSGEAYSELVHTLDVNRTGVRLGAVRRQLEVGSMVLLQYRQHKAEFRVVWVKPLGSGAEQQIGLEAGAQRDLWGLETTPTNRPSVATSETGRPVSPGV